MKGNVMTVTRTKRLHGGWWEDFATVFLVGSMTLVGLLTPSWANPDASRFVETSAKQGISVLSNRTQSAEDRRASFGRIIADTFDHDKIGAFVVSSVWQAATPEQKKRFIAVFKRALVNIYIDRFFDYDGQSLRVIGTRPFDKESTLVKTSVSTPTGKDSHTLDWQIIGARGKEKVFDVVIDGVSTTQTTKQDYEAVLKASDGNFDRLITLLEAKTK